MLMSREIIDLEERLKNYPKFVEGFKVTVRAAILSPHPYIRYQALETIYDWSKGKIRKGYVEDNKIFVEAEFEKDCYTKILICDVPPNYSNDEPVAQTSFDFDVN